MNDNDTEFDELNRQVTETQKKLEEVITKLTKTETDFEVERIAKEARDLEQAVAEATAEFETRSGERKQAFDDANGILDDKKNALKNNLDEIQRLEGEIANEQDAGQRATLEGELETARDATQGLRDEVSDQEDVVNPLLLAEAQDQYYMKKGLEYIAYENLRKAREAREGAESILNEAAADLPDLEFDLE